MIYVCCMWFVVVGLGSITKIISRSQKECNQQQYPLNGHLQVPHIVRRLYPLVLPILLCSMQVFIGRQGLQPNAKRAKNTQNMQVLIKNIIGASCHEIR